MGDPSLGKHTHIYTEALLGPPWQWDTPSWHGTQTSCVRTACFYEHGSVNLLSVCAGGGDSSLAVKLVVSY